MGTANRYRAARRTRDGLLRVFCYALGPLSAALILRFRHSADIWSIRFHAFHSILLTTVGAALWGALRTAEHLAPWFLSVLLRELRFAMTLGFLVAWAFILITAWGGRRCATVPWIHEWAVRLARRTEPGPQTVQRA